MASGRRELTWSACDALAASGRKPSISSVREWTLTHHGKKQGSDTDTQADINAWYALLLAMKQEKQSIAGLPEEVAALARTMWLKANDAATEALASHRAAVDAELDSAHQKTAAALLQAQEAEQRTAATLHELDVARESIRRLEESQSALRATAQATEVRHTAHLQARDDRIATLVRESGQQQADHAARVLELEGLRRHALMQIEEARTESRHWRSEAERLTTSHQAALAAQQALTIQTQAELAGTRGRLSAIEEALANSQQRSAMLEAALEAALSRAQPDTATGASGAAGGARTGRSRAVRTPSLRRR